MSDNSLGQPVGLSNPADFVLIFLSGCQAGKTNKFVPCRTRGLPASKLYVQFAILLVDLSSHVDLALKILEVYKFGISLQDLLAHHNGRPSLVCHT